MINTYVYNVRSSWNKHIKAQATGIQADLRVWIAAPGTTRPYSAVELPYYAEKQPESYPSIRGWLLLPDVPTPARSRLVDTVQLDIFIKSLSSATPDKRLLEFIQGSLMQRLDIRTGRNGFYGYFDVYDYAANPTNPRKIGRCRIESRSGFRDMPDDDPLISRRQADFRLIHK